MIYRNHRGTSSLLLPCPSSPPWAHIPPPKFISSAVCFLDCPKNPNYPVKFRQQDESGFNKDQGRLEKKKSTMAQHTPHGRRIVSAAKVWNASLLLGSFNSTPGAAVPRTSQSLCPGKRNLCWLESLRCCAASCSWPAHPPGSPPISARPARPG